VLTPADRQGAPCSYYLSQPTERVHFEQKFQQPYGHPFGDGDAQ